MSHYAQSSLARRHRYERTRGFGARGLPTIKITSASGRNKSYGSNESKTPSLVNFHDHPRAWHNRSCGRQLLHILSSQTLILNSAAFDFGHSNNLNPSLACHSSDSAGHFVHRKKPSKPGTTEMTSTTAYDLLWSHQIMLLREIDSMNHQITVTRQTLEHAEYVLSQETSSRKAKKKSSWVRSTTEHTLRDREQDVTVLLHNLIATQTQIANAHQATQTLLARGGSLPQSPFLSVNEPSPGDRFDAPSNAPLPQYNRTFSRAVTTPPTDASFANMNQSLLRPPVGPAPGRRRDSGFDEPPLFAHPFDLDTTTMNTSSHVFAHEMMLSPMNTAPAAPLTAPTAFVPAPAISVSPAPATLPPASGRTTPTLDPTANEFNYALPVPVTSRAKRQKKTTFAVPDLLDATSTSDTEAAAAAGNPPNLNPSAPTFSPSTESSDKETTNAKHKRRYSEAAINIIENRLRGKNNQQPQAPWGSKTDGGNGGGSSSSSSGTRGNVYRRRGKSIADVAVQMVYSNNKGMEISEEMVWPLTA